MKFKVSLLAGKCGTGMDVKDAASDVGDEISHESKKLKNKVD